MAQTQRLSFSDRQRHGNRSSAVHAILLAFLLSFTTSYGWTQMSIPNTRSGHVLRAWLDAVNSGNPAKIQEYVRSIDSTQTVDWLVSLSQHSGGFSLLSVTSKGPWLISFHVKEKESATEAFGSIRVRDSMQLRVLSFTLRPLPPNALIEDKVLDRTEKERVIDGVIINLKAHYLYSDVAGKMADALLKSEQREDEREETDGGAFAFSITKQLRDISHDKHLEVIYNPFKLPQARQPAVANGAAHPPEERRRDNCGISNAKILAGNIGYLKVDAFSDPVECRSGLDVAMVRLNNAAALIFDLRQNHGGDPRMVDLIASYLFDQPTHLNDMYNPRSKATEEYWTHSPIPGNKLANKPALVLTSSMTISGGEEFCYDLKMLKRATIVGERTGGGAHIASLHRIDDHFAIAVPFAKPVNPISKSDWEGTGVVPDIEVKEGNALARAAKLARNNPK
jgi:retinol-binding protein 3